MDKIPAIKMLIVKILMEVINAAARQDSTEMASTFVKTMMSGNVIHITLTNPITQNQFKIPIL